jgi:cellulose synthase (UDP-forming)
MGPEDLGAFFKQQHRWAQGTVGMLPKLLFGLLTEPFRYPPSFWWEYFLSSSYYLVGWVYFVLMLGPVLYLFFDVPVYIFPPVLYALLVIPYNILANAVFYWTLCRRGYLFRDLFAGVILGMISMPVYMDASLKALLGIRGTFTVTPKGQTSTLSMRDLWPQIGLALLSFITLVWGILRLTYEQEPFFGLIVNIMWIFYYFLVFSSIFWFNRNVSLEGLRKTGYARSRAAL